MGPHNPKVRMIPPTLVEKLVMAIRTHKELESKRAFPIFEFAPNVPRGQAIIVSARLTPDRRPRVVLHPRFEKNLAELEAAFPDPDLRKTYSDLE